MGGDSFKHIQTLANVNDLAIQLYAINASTVVFFGQSFAAKHFSDVVLIIFYLITSFSLFSINIITFIFYKIKENGFVMRFFGLLNALRGAGRGE